MGNKHLPVKRGTVLYHCGHQDNQDNLDWYTKKETNITEYEEKQNQQSRTRLVKNIEQKGNSAYNIGQRNILDGVEVDINSPL